MFLVNMAIFFLWLYKKVTFEKNLIFYITVEINMQFLLGALLIYYLKKIMQHIEEEVIHMCD